MTPRQTDMLRRLAVRVLSVVDMTDEELATVQGLVKAGYARDFGDQKGRRIPVVLRLWGITRAGRAILEQQSIIDSTISRQARGQFSLTIDPRPRLNRLNQPTQRIKPLMRDKQSTLFPERKPKKDQ